MKFEYDHGYWNVTDTSQQETDYLVEYLTYPLPTGKAYTTGSLAFVSQGRLQGKIVQVVSSNDNFARVICPQKHPSEVFSVPKVALQGVYRCSPFFKSKDGKKKALFGVPELIRQSTPLEVHITGFEPTPSIPPVEQFGDISLYDYQLEAVNRSLASNRGIIWAATGSGKSLKATSIFLSVLKQHPEAICVFCVPSIALRDQYLNDAQDYGISHLTADIRQVSPKTRIIVGTKDSLSKQKNIDKIERSRVRVIIADECHMAQATVYRSLIQYFYAADYVFGLSASPFESKNPITVYKDCMVWSLFGPPIIRISSKFLVERGVLARPYVHFVRPLVPVRPASGGQYNQVRKTHIQNNHERNNQIVSFVTKALDHGLSTIVLCGVIEHASLLMQMIACPSSMAVFGNNKGKIFKDGFVQDIRANYDQIRDDFNSGKVPLLFGSSTLDTGFDVHRVKLIVMAAGGKSSIVYNQRLGRGVRKKRHGKNEVFIVDFVDSTHVITLNHTRLREQEYLDRGASIVTSLEFWHRIGGTHEN